MTYSKPLQFYYKSNLHCSGASYFKTLYCRNLQQMGIFCSKLVSVSNEHTTLDKQSCLVKNPYLTNA
jgi:hypothetical protein